MTTLISSRWGLLRFLPVAVLGFCSLASVHVTAADFFVATDGDDANPGTQAQPFATLGAARDAVRQALAASPETNVRVIVRGGTYRISQPLTFHPQDGGNAQTTVTYQATTGETPVFSGGRPITQWVDNQDGTWSANVPEVKAGRWRFRELYVNGTRRPRARHPNDGYLRVVQSGPDRRTSFTFRTGDIPRSALGPNLELLFLHDWSTSRVRVSSIDHDSNVLTVADPIGCQAPHYRIDHFEKHPRYRLENDPALLDAPGEWHLDETSGQLTYRPLPDETLARFAEDPPIAPLATSLLEVRGDDTRAVRNLHFIGLHFRHCAWPIPDGGYAAGQAGFHERRDGKRDSPLRELLPAAVSVQRAENCRFENGSVTRVGGSGIWLGSRCRNCVVAGCVIRDVAGNGVLVGEDRSRQVERRSWCDVAPDQVASGNVLSNNLIESCGQLYFGAVGVWVGMAERTEIVHNEIRYLPYTGVSVGWMWNPTPTPCKSNRIARNHIHHVMQVLSDGGGIYTLGWQPGTVLEGNVIHDVPLNAGRAESNGMFLDEGTTDLEIRDNLIYAVTRSPLRFHRAGKNQVRNNVLAVRENIPLIRYNTTDPEDIELTDNQPIQSDTWHPAAGADTSERIQALVAEAGLEEQFQHLTSDK